MRKEQKGIKVLHVDNEPDFLALTKAFLERENENFSVDTATSAEEAIALLKGGKYDVVVSDYLMPVMDGLEFLKTLRASGNTIPFIMFTGKGREEVAIEALNRGANGYLQKGTDIESMFGTLTHVIRAEVAKTRAEDALQESEKHFRALIENSSDIIQIVDSEGVIRYVSPSVQQILGYKPEELIGRLSIDAVHLDDLPKVARGFEKALQEPEVPVIVECRCKHKNGAWRIIEGIGVNRLDDPSVNGFISNMHDITERKQAEEELQESKERLHTVVSNAPGVIWALDKDGIFILSEGRGLKALGLRPGEVIGKSVFDVYRDVPKIIENNRRALAGESFVSIVEAGELIFESYYSPIQDKNGEVIGMSGVSNDITERKAVENALQESEEKYRTIFETTGTAAVIVEEDMTLSMVNAEFEKRSGYSKEEVEGKKKFPEFVAKDDLERMKEYHRLRRTDPHAAPRSYEFQFIDKLGNVRDCFLAISMIPGTKKSVASLLDITEHKQAEKERELLLKELEAKNRELGRFTYTVSHDLRSPLVTIQGFTDMLQKDLAQNELEKAKDNLTFIDKAATKMEKLLSDTLELSRIGRMVNPPEDVSFGDIVEDALAQTAEQLKSSGVEVSVAEDFPTVHVDRMRIAEVLTNLIVNSINYRGEQPHPKIEIGHRVDGEETVFFVRDNGVGIDPSQHEKVFELFYQVDANGGGTGAGLAIVRRIIEVHNGRIGIESEKGKGCTVCFTLPVV